MKKIVIKFRPDNMIEVNAHNGITVSEAATAGVTLIDSAIEQAQSITDDELYEIQAVLAGKMMKIREIIEDRIIQE